MIPLSIIRFFYAKTRFNLLLMLHRATELRNICRKQLKQAQKVQSTETIFKRSSGTLYLFSFSLISATNISQRCCFALLELLYLREFFEKIARKLAFYK